MTKQAKSKIKHRHDMIPHLLGLLRQVEHWSEIQRICPGGIRRGGHSGHPFGLTVQRQTETGLGCIAKSKGLIQEVFFITAQPEVLEKKLTSFCRNKFG